MRRLSRDENRLSSRIQKWKSESVFGKKLFDSIRFKRINVTFSKWTNVTVKTRQKPSCSEYFTLYRIDLCWTLFGGIKTRQCGSKWSIEKTNLRKENTTNNQQKQLLHEYLLEMSVSSDFLWNCGLFWVIWPLAKPETSSAEVINSHDWKSKVKTEGSFVNSPGRVHAVNHLFGLLTLIHLKDGWFSVHQRRLIDFRVLL